MSLRTGIKLEVITRYFRSKRWRDKRFGKRKSGSNKNEPVDVPNQDGNVEASEAQKTPENMEIEKSLAPENMETEPLVETPKNIETESTITGNEPVAPNVGPKIAPKVVAEMLKPVTDMVKGKIN